ncbi:MAG TPA: LacI family DNA-binding transcriptional regulator [Actinomycetota bacterium]|nr:LacI family DNA-binding transcriptional regulator [Actinomycetota bacterium]
MARPRVGIKDVAAAAGVSITTVSHALSGKGRLPERTRERVRAIAAELGYTPHPVARSLASGRTGLLATVVSVRGNATLAFTEIDYYMALMNGATRAAIEHGYGLVLAPSTAGSETWGVLPLDGVIVVDPADGDPRIPTLRSLGVPIVFVGRDPNGRPDDLVVQNDRHAATRDVCEHLARAGAARVGVVTLAPFESFTEECLEAYRDWCARRGQEPVVHLVPGDSTSDVATFRSAADAFLDAPERPDAVFCLYERLAAEVLAGAAERRIRVPRDLLVVTIAEVGLAASMEPPLTTLEINQQELGAAAAAALVASLRGEPARSVLDVPTRIVPRASTSRRTSRRADRGVVASPPRS